MTADLIAGERSPHAPDVLPDPDGCYWCGNRRGNHGSQYVRPVGLHKWTKPTDAQRLTRMKARRTQQKENQP